MNEISYFANNKKTSSLAKRIVTKYDLEECYSNKKDKQVYINDNLLFCVNKRYIFMRSLNINSNDDYWAIRKELMG